MNEFCAKKLGEVMAFAKVGIETFEKGNEGFLKLFTEIKIADLKKENQEHISAIEEQVNDKDVSDTTLKKNEATSVKLIAMRDLYVKDEWHNPAELCEWLGFFEGAAVVHWTLVKGVAEGLGDKNLEELADRAIIFHEEILKTVSLCLYNIGKEKSL